MTVWLSWFCNFCYSLWRFIHSNVNSRACLCTLFMFCVQYIALKKQLPLRNEGKRMMVYKFYIVSSVFAVEVPILCVCTKNSLFFNSGLDVIKGTYALFAINNFFRWTIKTSYSIIHTFIDLISRILIKF